MVFDYSCTTFFGTKVNSLREDPKSSPQDNGCVYASLTLSLTHLGCPMCVFLRYFLSRRHMAPIFLACKPERKSDSIKN